MLNYELCKKLKEAGFSQNKTQWKVYVVSTPSAAVNAKDYYALREEDLGQCEVVEVCDCPTLSELIEACGEGFETLTRCDEQLRYTAEADWVCNLCEVGPEGETWTESDSYGATPEEAVANLWLKLNGK